MHLAVFGGSFDPPHNGHLALCLFARELLEIDRIIISVSNNPLKQSQVARDADRLAMARLLSAEINLAGECSEVSRWELDQLKPSYTIDLLRHIRALYPDATLTLLVGEDSYRDFSLWKEPEEICSLAGIAVFGRKQEGGHPSLPETGVKAASVRLIDFATPVSSSAVRRLIAAGGSVEGLVPASVLRYITEQKLYSQPPIT
ncbi:MAG: nicotinate (nicotinamide) nucleotide adenylyltransferase [Chlorobiaceae bacterium]